MAIFLPFNFNPTSTTTLEAESNSYTVPAGSYAMVFYTLSVSAKGSSISATEPISSNSNSSSGWFVVVAGDAITVSESAASVADSLGSSSGRISDTSTAAILVESSSVAALQCGVEIGKGGTGDTIRITGSARAEAQICVYAIP